MSWSWRFRLGRIGPISFSLGRRGISTTLRLPFLRITRAPSGTVGQAGPRGFLLTGRRRRRKE